MHVDRRLSQLYTCISHKLWAFAFAATLGGVLGCTDASSTAPPRLAPGQAQRLVPCEDWTCDPGNGGGTGFPGQDGGIALPGFTWSTCTSPELIHVDVDGDSVDDDCERAVATAFAPLLKQSTEEWDYEWSRGLVGGEYYWAVTEIPGTDLGFGTVMGSVLRIAYLPAYYFDLGTGNSLLDNFGSGGHKGDSEFIMVDVWQPADKWIFQRAFTSAHCTATWPNPLNFITQSPNCQWWNADHWDNVGNPNERYADNVPHGAPFIWVSRRKHANYVSYQTCQDASGEGCAGVYVSARFPVTEGFNMGSSAHPLNAVVSGRRNSPYTFGGMVEPLWGIAGYEQPFHGWQSIPWDDNPTPYGAILRQFGF